MRSTAVACLIVLAVAGCDGQLLTGPDAQRAFVQARRLHGPLPPGVVVVVDGVRLPDSVGYNGFFRHRDPATIDYAMVTIDPAVTRLYGPTVGRVFFITTKSASAPNPPWEKVRAMAHQHGPIALAAPRFIMVSGPPLRSAVIMADWQENLKFMLSLSDTAAVPGDVQSGRPSLSMALFGGPDWFGYEATPQALARLRPDDANQHGRFLPAHKAQPALVLLGPPPGLARVRVLRVSERGLALLSRHGVPVRLD